MLTDQRKTAFNNENLNAKKDSENHFNEIKSPNNTYRELP